MKRQRFMNVLQKTFQPPRKRSEPPIESNHQQTSRGKIIVCICDCGEFFLIQAERLLAEDMLAGVESCRRLSGVKMVGGCYNNRIEPRIVNNFLLIGSAGPESEFLSSMLRLRATGRTHRYHFDSGYSLHRR